MSERRVPRFEDDYSAELPTWPPRRPSVLTPKAPDGASAEADDGRSALRASPELSSQGAYPAPTAVPPVRSLAGGTVFSFDDAAPTSTTRREKAAASPAPAFALCEPSLVLLRLIGAYHGESDTAVIERAVAHYADAIGVHVLARPMILPCEAGGPKDGRDTRLAPARDHAQRGGGGAPPSSGFAVPRERGEIPGADAQAPP